MELGNEATMRVPGHPGDRAIKGPMGPDAAVVVFRFLEKDDVCPYPLGLLTDCVEPGLG